jgi:hypothetical protein
MKGFLCRAQVLVTTGAAPYLGDSPTWDALREAAPDYEFLELDTLRYADSTDILGSLRAAITERLPASSAIIAHGAMAAVTLEAVAFASADIPVLLLSPMIATRHSWSLEVLRLTLTRGIGGKLLSRFAASKHARLLKDPSYVREQLALLVRDEHIDDGLVAKALERLADPLCSVAVRHTTELLRLSLRAIDPSVVASVKRKLVLVERGRAAKYQHRGLDAIEVDRSRSAIMLDAPQAVADALRSTVPACADVSGGSTAI